MKHSRYEAVVKSFQALSIGVGGLFIMVAEATAGSPATVVKPVKMGNGRTVTQVASPFEAEADPAELATHFHKPNRIGLSQVKDLLRE